MQMILNELSLNESETDINKAVQVFEQFIHTYSNAIKKENGFERSILTERDLKSLEIAAGYNVSKWRNNTLDRDLLRRFIDMCDRQVITDFCQDETELTCEKGSGKGLLAAYENEAFCISFVYDSYWERYEISCTYYSLAEDYTLPVSVYNLSHPDQLTEYSRHFQEIRKKRLRG